MRVGFPSLPISEPNTMHSWMSTLVPIKSKLAKLVKELLHKRQHNR